MVLNFTGDIVLADLFERYREGIGSRLSDITFNPFIHFHEYFKNGDINVINLESVLSGCTSKKYPWSEIMRGSPESVNLLKRNHIHVVNLANNHSLDHGLDAFKELTENLDKEGILHFGGPRDTFQESPASINYNGQNISFLGYYVEESLSVFERDSLLDRIINNVQSIRNNDSILVLSLHWGSEYSDKAFKWMISSGKKLIEAGVTILYGHHSHTYQGVASYRDGVFAPGLGNFIFEDIFIKNRRSALLQVEILNKGMNFRTIPYTISRKGIPVPSSDSDSNIDRLNSQLENILRADDPDTIEWDEDIKHQIKMGHIKNRIKIRFNVLTHPGRYSSFILKR